jgi:hypothetical protein
LAALTDEVPRPGANAPPRITLFIDPPTHHFLQDRLFDASTARRHGDNILAPFIAVRDVLARDGIRVHTADLMPTRPDGGRNLYASLGRIPDMTTLTRRPDLTLSAFFAMECPIVEPSLYSALPRIQRHLRRIFTWCDPDQLIPFTGTQVRSQHFIWPQCADGVDEESSRRTERKFMTMINANKLPRLYDRELYTARLRAVEFFHRHGEIDLYGRGWDRAPMRVGRTLVPARLRRLGSKLWEARQRQWPNPLYTAVAQASRGPVDSKLDTLAGYRFAICFENMTLQGWITEKVFDCFRAGCVPVYLGAPNVTDHIPPTAFIDMRQFANFDELRRFLHSLAAPDLERYREAARDFMESSAFDPFRPRAFAEIFRRIVREDAGT